MRLPPSSFLAVRFCLAGLMLAGCGVSRGIRPLGEGRTAVTASAGGPMFANLGTPMPIPLTTVGVAHGVHDRVDLHGGAHITSAGLFGIYGLELGAGVLLLEQKSPAAPALMADITLNGFSGNLGEGDPPGGTRVFPEVDLRASWAWGQREHLVYTGPSTFSQVSPFATVPYWALGNQFMLGDLDLTVEGRWIAPWEDPKSVTVDWVGMGGAGVLAVHLGARYKFGKVKEKAPPPPPDPAVDPRWGVPVPPPATGGAR